MKSAIISILIFNGKIILTALALALYVVFSDVRGPSIKIQGLAIILLAVWVIGNIKIVIDKRKGIAYTIKRGSIEAVAAVIEFKEIANLRAQERIREKIFEPRKPNNSQSDLPFNPSPSPSPSPPTSTKEHMVRHNGALMRVSDIPKESAEVKF